MQVFVIACVVSACGGFKTIMNAPAPSRIAIDPSINRLSKTQSAKICFDHNIKPLIQNHCVACHTGNNAHGKLDLSDVASGADRDKDLLNLIVDKVVHKEMPPGQDDMSTGQRAFFLSWRESNFNYDCSGSDPVIAGVPDKVTFELDIKPLIEQRCLSCHGSNAKVKLTPDSMYNQNSLSLVASRETAFPFLDRVSKAVVSRVMPPGQPLADYQIAMFARWANQGFPKTAEDPIIDRTSKGSVLTIAKPVDLTNVAKPNFADHILPLLKQHGCASCHSGSEPAAGLDLTSVIYPLSTRTLLSRWMDAYNWAKANVMPPAPFATMSDNNKAAFKRWIDSGMPENSSQDRIVENFSIRKPSPSTIQMLRPSEIYRSILYLLYASYLDRQPYNENGPLSYTTPADSPAAKTYVAKRGNWDPVATAIATAGFEAAPGQFTKAPDVVTGDFLNDLAEIAVDASTNLYRVGTYSLDPCLSSVGDENTAPLAQRISCVKGAIAAFAGDAQRRVLTPAEVDELYQIFAAAGGISTSSDRNLNSRRLDEAMKRVIGAVLFSPYFLYRLELGSPVTADTYRLNTQELASKFSFTTTGTPPRELVKQYANDGSIVSASARKELLLKIAGERTWTSFENSLPFNRTIGDFNDIRETTFRSEFSSPFRERLANFTEDWLSLRYIPIDTEIFSNEMKVLFQQTFLGDVHSPFWWGTSAQSYYDKKGQGFVINPQKQGNFATLLTTNLTFKDWNQSTIPYTYGGAPDLSLYYHGHYFGLYPITSGRPGILTRMAVLAQPYDEVHTLVRGAKVYRTFTCNDIMTPTGLAGDIANIRLDASQPKKTQLERITLGNPTCAQCHTKFNGFAFALGRFDVKGAYQPNETLRLPDGATQQVQIDTTGSVVLDNTQIAVSGPAQLADIMAKSDEVNRCFVKKWLQFTENRPIRYADMPLIIELSNAQKGVPGAPGTLYQMMESQITAPEFELRVIGQ
jgi:uncharacterized membrane protein